MLSPSETHPARIPYPDWYSWTPPTDAFHLPGFVEAGVTYESHEFWVEFDKPRHANGEGFGAHCTPEFRARVMAEEVERMAARPEGTIWCKNGGGVSSLRIGWHYARPLRTLLALASERQSLNDLLADKTPTLKQDSQAYRDAFHMLWGIFQIARDTAVNEASAVQREIYTAFAEGRLKKRKVRGSSTVRVTMEARKPEMRTTA